MVLAGPTCWDFHRITCTQSEMGLGNAREQKCDVTQRRLFLNKFLVCGDLGLSVRDMNFLYHIDGLVRTSVCYILKIPGNSLKMFSEL